MPLSDFTEDEIRTICHQCTSFSAMARALNYASKGAILYTIRNYLNKHNIDYSHFTHVNANAVKRTPENIFIENSTATQHVLRVYYLKGNYTPYKCAICGQEPFWNNKPMTLILDHINGHNNDNRLENLRWVCGNCDRQLPTTTGCNKKHGMQTDKYNFCIDCGRKILKPSIRCFLCNSKTTTKPPQATIITQSGQTITRDELKALIRQTPIIHIARQFNVSDNTIRRWCKRFNLPFAYKKIHSISDETWRTT